MTSQLKEAREKAGYTIENVADKLNIRKQYLIALEEEDYESLPGKIYINGYTKIYQEFLGIKIPLEESNEDINPSNSSLRSASNDNGKKYRKYIIFCSISLLVLVVILFNYLKSYNEFSFLTSQLNNLHYGNNQEIFSGYY